MSVCHTLFAVDYWSSLALKLPFRDHWSWTGILKSNHINLLVNFIPISQWVLWIFLFWICTDRDPFWAHSFVFLTNFFSWIYPWRRFPTFQSLSDTLRVCFSFSWATRLIYRFLHLFCGCFPVESIFPIQWGVSYMTCSHFLTPLSAISESLFELSVDLYLWLAYSLYSSLLLHTLSCSAITHNSTQQD